MFRIIFRIWNVSSLFLSLSVTWQSLTDFEIRYNPKETRKSARERLICWRDGSAIILVPPAGSVRIARVRAIEARCIGVSNFSLLCLSQRERPAKRSASARRQFRAQMPAAFRRECPRSFGDSNARSDALPISSRRRCSVVATAVEADARESREF